MGDSHQLAMYLGLASLLGIALWHRAPIPAKAAGLVGLGLTAYVLVHAAGRSEFLSLAVGAVLLAFWRPSRFPAFVMLAVLAAAFAFPQVADTALERTLGQASRPIAEPTSSAEPTVISVGERFSGLEGDRSLQIRLTERWPMFFAIAMRDPLLGAGPSAATEAADGYYVRSLTEVGILGTAAFAALVLSVVLALRRVVRSTAGDARAAAVGLLSGTVFVALVGILIDSWVASRVMQLYWPAVGATLAILATMPSRWSVPWPGTTPKERVDPAMGG
jgi:hypothetical protein